MGDEIDELLEGYLNERNGLVAIYRRQRRLNKTRSHAFYIAVSLEDWLRITAFMPMFWKPEDHISNDGMYAIVQHLLDTE